MVAPAGIAVGKKALSVPVTYPSAPGRYRLTISLHDKDGVAYDAATQAMIPSLIVRVTGDFDGAIQAAPTAAVTAGTSVTFGVNVTNLGQSDVGPSPRCRSRRAPLRHRPRTSSVAGSRCRSARACRPTRRPRSWAPPCRSASSRVTGAKVDLPALAPPVAGDYLLMLDIVTPDRGSLVASGADPTLIRVTVSAAPTP